MEKIVFFINKKGDVTMETTGFKGTTCADVTEKILLSLNGQIVDEKKKPEYWDSFEVGINVVNKK